jgi:hypothetical protein
MKSSAPLSEAWLDQVGVVIEQGTPAAPEGSPMDSICARNQVKGNPFVDAIERAVVAAPPLRPEVRRRMLQLLGRLGAELISSAVEWFGSPTSIWTGGMQVYVEPRCPNADAY